MSMKLRYEDSDKLEVILGSLVNTCGELGVTIQRRAAKVITARIVNNLNELRTKTKDEVYTHMADDVRIRAQRDKYGNTIVKVNSGKKTGSLWHVVNDGAYNKKTKSDNKATHFMDLDLSRTEGEIDNIVDEELMKAGF